MDSQPGDKSPYVFSALLNRSIVLVVLRTRSYRTLRDGSFGWRFSRHFVPGYDRTVPPGQLDNNEKHWDRTLNRYKSPGYYRVSLRDEGKTCCLDISRLFSVTKIASFYES
jgi:hypothetical protein